MTGRGRTAPGALPVLGHALPLGRRPLDFLASLPAHGDLVRIKLGPVPFHVLCDPDLVHQVLVDDRTYDKGGAIFDLVRTLAGNGLATCPHRDHRRQRRLLQPAFHRDRLPLYAEVMSSEITAMLDGWRPGRRLDVLAEMNGLTATLATRTLFAAHLDDATFAELRQCMHDALTGMMRRMILPWRWLNHLPTPGNRRFERARRRLRHYVARLTTDYRRTGVDHGDLLSILLAVRDDDGRALTEAEIHDQVFTFYLGGSETTAPLLSWALYLLARNPGVRERLHAEVDAVLGGRIAGHDDLPALDLTRRVLLETLRLYPPGWLFTRVTTRPVELAGHRLPAGSVVLYSPHIVHHRADLFPDPERFDPDRWRDDTDRLPRGVFTPFGGGARKCIGEVFATIEATLALASITARWQLDPLPGARTRLAPRLSSHLRSLPMSLRERRTAV
ncbi:cytochrome P450 [Kitasatospora brasiliensis]|uniref:cytochrome P450 n=1 Tax=Kitasatospora brasiliensis TaxID=3058040 RepID=UPI00292F7FEE|nr:cytochrome P450 [Kitasatospora sp. K002]